MHKGCSCRSQSELSAVFFSPCCWSDFTCLEPGARFLCLQSADLLSTNFEPTGVELRRKQRRCGTVFHTVKRNLVFFLRIPFSPTTSLYTFHAMFCNLHCINSLQAKRDQHKKPTRHGEEHQHTPHPIDAIATLPPHQINHRHRQLITLPNCNHPRNGHTPSPAASTLPTTSRTDPPPERTKSPYNST